MSNLFHIIDDAFVILRTRGVFRQAKIYRRAGLLYAQHGGGFVRLMQNGTSAPNVGIEALETDFPVRYNALGYMKDPSAS